MNNFAELVRAALPDAAKGKPIEVWFQDETRIGQQGTLTRLRARKGTRPRARKDRRHAWACIFGAVCPARATGAALVMPQANTDTTNAHLAEISRHVSPGAHAILVLDGAGWHSSRKIVVPPNISLLTLPPYSPELNPVENVWQFLRQNRLANRVFDSCDAIVDLWLATPGTRSSQTRNASPPSPHETGHRSADNAAGIRGEIRHRAMGKARHERPEVGRLRP